MASIHSKFMANKVYNPILVSKTVKKCVRAYRWVRLKFMMIAGIMLAFAKQLSSLKKVRLVDKIRLALIPGMKVNNH